MKIVITGVPGSGKSTLAKALAKKMKVQYLDLNAIAKKYAVKKKVGKEFEIDLHKLQRVLVGFLEGKTDFVLEGHLACEIKIPCDLVIILRCNPLVLAKRLETRRYDRQKVVDNILAEAQDYFSINVEHNYLHFIEVDTTKRLSVAKLIKFARARKGQRINWNKALFILASQGL